VLPFNRKAFVVRLNKIVSKIMLPSAILMSKLDLRTKLTFLFATLMLPIVVLAYYAISQQQNQIAVVEGELKGVAVAREVIHVITTAQVHRGLVSLKLNGENNDAELAQVRKDLATRIDKLETVIALYPELDLDNQWKPIGAELRQLIGGKTAANATISFAQHTRLIDQTPTFFSYSNETSGLLLDPEAATYFLMDISVEKMPRWIEHLAVLRGLGAQFLKSNDLSFESKALMYSRMELLRDCINELTHVNGPLQRSGEKILPEQQKAVDASKAFNEIVRTRVIPDDNRIAAAEYFKLGTKSIDTVMEFHGRMLDRLDYLLKERDRTLERSSHIIYTVLTLTLLATLYLVYGFYRGFMRALRSVGDSALAVASGDLTKKVHIYGTDELSQTGDTLEQMNSNLSALVANVRTNASMVSQLGQHLATGISDLSVRTEQQAASLEETSSSVTELAETVQKNAKSAQAVDELAHDLSNLAESSGGTMNSAVETMESIQSSAREVQEIVGIIDGIAFQTNILALNAAVEAARAGEQGKGFAVVATEVRDLAQRSATSARQIRRLIDESVNRVEAGVSLIGEVSETLADIVAGIRELAANVASISSASVNQSAGLAHISEAVQELDEITQRNGKMADQAKGVAVTLEERAKHLADAVATFKLRQGTADEAFTLTRKAVGLYKVQGPRALKTITADEEKKYADRDMYVFAFDREGKYHAFAGNSSKLGVSLLEVKGLDGRKLVDDAFAVPEGGGWVNYTIPNPISNKIESKSSFIEKVEDDLVMGCGVYKIS
jgi:methyl-accepting chemotaxis protein